MISFIDLGEDIICNDILGHLDPQSFLNLSLTCKAVYRFADSNHAYHQLYQKKFGDSVPRRIDDYRWKHLFQQRSKKSVNLFTWGSGDHGRLGYLLSLVPPEHRASALFGVNTPTEVHNFKNCVIDLILSGGYSFQVLVSGRLFCVGSNYTDGTHRLMKPCPSQHDFSPTLGEALILNAENLRGIRNSHIYHSEENSREQSFQNLAAQRHHGIRKSHRDLQIQPGRFLNELFLSPPYSGDGRQITRISGGRSHILALDNHGLVHSWDTGLGDWRTSVRIRFEGLSHEVKRVVAGWNASACYMKDVGLLYWSSRAQITKEKYDIGDYVSEADYVIIPHLEGVTEFELLSEHIIYIGRDGILYSHKLTSREDSDERTPCTITQLLNFDIWLQDYNRTKGKEARFSKLTACYRSFTIYTDDDQVLIGQQSTNMADTMPELIPELQNRGITQIAMGDYHSLALTQSGDLLCWGLDLQNRGCLGIGPTFESSVIRANRSTKFSIPRSVCRPGQGKWLFVTASGWHLGGLFISE